MSEFSDLSLFSPFIEDEAAKLRGVSELEGG